MDAHNNAGMTPKKREDMVRAVVESGLTRLAAALRYNTTPNTVAKWVGRFRMAGVDGLCNRPSSPSQIPVAACVAVEELRRKGHTGKQIAAKLPLTRDRQSYPAAPGTQQTQFAGAGGACAAL